MTDIEILNATEVKKNNKGTVSLIFGILSIVTSFVGVGFILGISGLIFGVIGLKQIKRYKQNGKRMAVIGLFCCLVGIFLTVIFSITAGNALFS
ncbi:DUF4190 domain-containing protein [Oceanobacillus saliphilus]|uniref:DUF4190 domain-containing protein n=1 Tax=Oceanobacillus saliphilus TaxID=2925834 RepID=UPI00201E27D1|nr:DUF4190 domain-containing protein [Oceanobacillus saliphilus]